MADSVSFTISDPLSKIIQKNSYINPNRLSDDSGLFLPSHTSIQYFGNFLVPKIA
ncbi:MAG: hypothetical protein JNL70_05680 [Saprospiraceae bacterium]|nr:hypothetical protein [Saprospiraceae bacterium]